MTRDEQLKFCEICKNQKLVFGQGIICGLTDKPADFVNSCESFEEDIELKEKVELKFKEDELINKTASQTKRLINYLVDLVCMLIFCFFFEPPQMLFSQYALPHILNIEGCQQQSNHCLFFLLVLQNKSLQLTL